MKELFAKKVVWIATRDPIFPLRAEIDGRPFRIRVNDWPDSPTVYSLVASDGRALDFDDWPPTWARPEAPPPGP